MLRRTLASVHDGPGRHRGLPPALPAMVCPGLALQHPGPVMTTAGAAEPIRAAQGGEIGRACGRVGKASLKGDQGAGKVGHGVAPGACVHCMFLSRPRPDVINILPWWKLGDDLLFILLKGNLLQKLSYII